MRYGVVLTLATTLALTVAAAASAQQPVGGRLLSYGTTSWTISPFGFPVPSALTLFDVDAGGGTAVPILLSAQPAPPAFQFHALGALDPNTRIYYVYTGDQLSGTITSIDVDTGTVVSSVPTVPNLKVLEFEASTNRLIALQLGVTGGGFYQLDPLSGSVALIGSAAPLIGVFGWGAPAAIDPVQNRLFLLHTMLQATRLAILDTVTGSVLSDVAIAGAAAGHLEYDVANSELIGFSGGGIYTNGPFAGIVSIDPLTGIATPKANGHPPITPVYPSDQAVALDEQRGLYHMVAEYQDQVSRLFAFDVATGHVVADAPVPPLIPPSPAAYTDPYLLLAIDPLAAPARGRVTPSPSNVISPGVVGTLTFEGPGHAGEFYLPFVSCNQGSWQVPGSNLVMPLAFDGCSQVYFYSPLSPTFFQLTPSGGLADILPPSGAAQGTVTMPANVPPGLAFDLYISFLTLSTSFQWTGVHGMAILHVSS